MKKFRTLLSVILPVVFLAGCIPQNYTDEMAEESKNKGNEIVEEWLDENYPGGSILYSSSHAEYYDGASEMTDLVTGKLNDGKADRSFVVRLSDENIFIEPNAAERADFDRAVKDYLLDCFGLDGDASFDELEAGTDISFRFSILSDPDEERSYTALYLIPEGIVLGEDDPVAYVNDPDSRDAIAVRAAITVSGDTPVDICDFSGVLDIQDKYGLWFKDLSIENDNEYWSPERYCRYAVTEWEGLEIRTMEYMRRQHMLGDQLQTNESEPDAVRNARLIQTDEGWHIDVAKGTEELYIKILARDDDEILTHEYTAVDEKGKETPLRWTQEGDAKVLVYDLTDGGTEDFIIKGTVDLVIRD